MRLASKRQRYYFVHVRPMSNSLRMLGGILSFWINDRPESAVGRLRREPGLGRPP